jgi:glucokinase
MNERLAVGVDVGGTKIAFALVNETGQILNAYDIPTQPEDGADRVIDRIADGIRALLDRAKNTVVGIGVGSPGYIELGKGIVRNAVNLYWTDVALVEELYQRLGRDLPIWLHKDANAAALGEMYFGAAQGYRDFVYIAIGTGLGGAAVMNGEILTGANEYAMEIGHLSLDANGRLCNCGLRGCPEIYIAKMGLLAGAKEYLSDYPHSSLAAASELSTQHIIDAARVHDPLARRVMEEAGEWLCKVLITSAAMFNPALFVIAGGLGHAAPDFFIEHARRELPQRTVYFTHEKLQIVESKLMSSAVGAACLVWHGLRTKDHIL